MGWLGLSSRCGWPAVGVGRGLMAGCCSCALFREWSLMIPFVEGTFLQVPSRLGRQSRQWLLAFTQVHPLHCPDRLHLQQGITIASSESKIFTKKKKIRSNSLKLRKARAHIPYTVHVHVRTQITACWLALFISLARIRALEKAIISPSFNFAELKSKSS